MPGDPDHLSGPQRILIFGGTFDPPHIAHARLPELAAQQLGCDLILYVPAAINPLKTQGPRTSNEHRLALLLLAIADVPNAKISTIELERKGPSYTIGTLKTLREQYAAQPKSAGAKGKRAALPEMRLLIGCDQALDFHRWKDWQEILKLATPAVMLRPPWKEQSFRKAVREKYSPVEAESWLNWTLRLPSIDVSASEIRNRLQRGDLQGLQEMLDPAVLDYIRVNKLYS